MFELNGKKALVTGSSQGIGYAVARCLAEHGAEVTVHCSRDPAKAERAMRETGGTHFITADLADRGAVEALFRETGPLDIVVANASVQFRRPFGEITEEEFDRQIDVNFRSSFLLMQRYIPEMRRKKWGRFVAVGSVQEAKPHPDMAIYAATKCAVRSLVMNAAKQAAPDGVTVNAVLPGVIDTPRNAEALSDPAYRQKVLAGIPGGTVGTPEDCAGAVLLLCSEAGRYITGSELYVDGGMHL